MTRRFILTGFISILFFSGSLAQMDLPKDYKAVINESFGKDKDLKQFEFSDQSQWLISKVGKPGRSMKCNGQGSYKDVNGGPAILALLKGYEFEDFVMELSMVQNGRDFNLLDFCIFFGVKDKDHYCYAQLASKADRKSHNVFEVKGDKPARLGELLEEGVIFGHNQWNQIRIERLVSAKTLKVYFNDKLVLETSDEPFMAGRIGFGSTKSAIKIDNLKVWAPSYTEVESSIF